MIFLIFYNLNLMEKSNFYLDIEITWREVNEDFVILSGAFLHSQKVYFQIFSFYLAKMQKLEIKIHLNIVIFGVLIVKFII